MFFYVTTQFSHTVHNKIYQSRACNLRAIPNLESFTHKKQTLRSLLVNYL